MKNTIKILGIAFVLVSNIAAASNQNYSDSVLTDDKTKKSSLVSYANPTLIDTELGTLRKYLQNVDDIILTNAKIVENDAMLFSSKFVSYADANLFEIEVNEAMLKNENTKTQFVHFLDFKLVETELGLLRKQELTVEEKIQLTRFIIDCKIANSANGFSKSQVNKAINTNNNFKF